MPLGQLIKGRRLALMLLLSAKGATGRKNEPVEGRTRLVKLLFLLDKEYDAFRRVAKLEFEAYAFGPYDAKIYDDLAFMENMGWIRGSAMSQPESAANLTFQELVHDRGLAEDSYTFLERPELYEADLSFEYLMSGVSEEVPQRYEARKYVLSPKGEEAATSAVQAFGDNSELSKLRSEIEEVKRRFNGMPLSDLLRFVYKKYPESATDSTILEDLRLR